MPDVAKVPEFEASVKGEVKVGKDVVVGLDDWISGDGGASFSPSFLFHNYLTLLSPLPFSPLVPLCIRSFLW